MFTPLISYEIHIVLVRTIYPLNIGSVSRAMSNMGAIQLHLIQPQCKVSYESQQMAANGQHGLLNRIEYSSWDDFINKNSEGIRIALSARDGRARKINDLKQELSKLLEIPNIRRANLNKIYLILGPEDCGLSGSDVNYAHVVCSLPTYGPNWSLNLAQAALLALFIIRDQWGGERTTLDGQHNTKSYEAIAEEPKATRKITFPDETLREWIELLGFDLSKRRINAYTVMRRIFLQHVPSSKEIRIFNAVLQQTIRKLKENQKYSSKNLNP